MNVSFSVYDETLEWCKKNAIKHIAFNQIESTNDFAKNEASVQLHSKNFYFADEQTRGRGRQQNVWNHSQKGHALYATWSFVSPTSPQIIAGPIFGLALYQSFKKIWSEGPFFLKPPNDIYIGDKKACGILLECINVNQGYRLIVGLGINVHSHPEGVDTATHLTAFIEVTPKTWHSFLTELNSAFTEATRTATGAHLTLEQRNQLLTALNANRSLSSPYTAISPFGDLTTAEKTISWRDL